MKQWTIGSAARFFAKLDDLSLMIRYYGGRKGARCIGVGWAASRRKNLFHRRHDGSAVEVLTP